MRNGAELLVDTLVRNGVDTVFGFPGDTSIAFYDVLSRRTDEIRHVLARDERHAGFMADSYSRTTQRLGVCEASSGAGAVYLASGLAEAFASSIPLLAITTDNSRRSMGTAPISEVDQEQLFAACTKWRRTADSTAGIPALLEEGIAAATTGRPGPVVLILPEDVLEGAAPHGSAGVARPEPGGAHVRTGPAARPSAHAPAVEQAAALLAAAARPVIVAGGGAHLSGAGEELRLFAEHAAVPVATSIHGKGIIDESHPLALGVVGSNGARPYANAWVAESDVVLFVGTRANGTDTLGFTVPDREGPARIVHIESDTERAGRNYPGSTPLVGDARTVIEQLRARVPRAAGSVRADRDGQLAAARGEWVRQEDERQAELRPGVLDPRDIVRALRDAFGRDTWVVADAGTPTPYLSCHWEAPGDGWRVVIPRGHGPMGFAVPASIGAAVGHPGERVLCLTTENSLAMAVGEWETAVRLALPVTYVVLDNTSMAWIKMIQHLYAGGRYFAVDPGPLDPVMLGLGMGIKGARAHTEEEFAALAKLAADHDGPSLIHAMVPEHMEVLPPVPAWQAAIANRSAARPIH